jgi:hypothetical protein
VSIPATTSARLPDARPHAGRVLVALAAIITAVLVAMVSLLAAPASASTLAGAQNGVGVIGQPGGQCVGADEAIHAGRHRQRAPAYDQTVVASGVGAEGGADGQSILEQAAQGQGNFGHGSADATQANELGNEWVGDNARLSSNGKALVSQDGLRQFRFPSFKPSWGNYQADFESRLTPSGPWTSNGHLTTTFGPPAP